MENLIGTNYFNNCLIEYTKYSYERCDLSLRSYCGTKIYRLFERYINFKEFKRRFKL